MEHASLWALTTQKKLPHSSLHKDLKIDVAIVGGGITGMTAALELCEAGLSVAVIEMNEVGGGTTGYSTGNLYVPVQPYYQNIVAHFDITAAKSVAQSRQSAIDYIENKVNEHNIKCHFARRPWYIFTNNSEKLNVLNKEIETLKQLGIDISEETDLELPLQSKKAAKIANQARLNPMQYVVALAEVVKAKGGHIYEDTKVTSIDEKKDHCVLITSGGQIQAKNVFIATHTPIGINLAQVFTSASRSYVVAIKADTAYPDAQWWDLDEPHHALSTHPSVNENPDVLMIAGSHHKTGQGENMQKHYQELLDYAQHTFPKCELAYQWSAQHYHSADSVPYIGLSNRFSKRTYIATGFFADGLVYGTLAGIIVANMIRQKSDVLSKTYQSNRFKPIASFPFLFKQNMDNFLQYIKDYAHKRPSQFDDLKKGEGKIVKLDGKKCAVSRDENNNLNIVSAVCTHMKCIVHWNNAESTWDCPCHGSRFTKEGKVIEGPAISNLEKINI